MGWGATAAYDDAFLIAGGDVVGQGTTDEIWRYDYNEGWIRMPASLGRPRNYFSAFVIPDGYVNCTSNAKH